MSPAQIAEANTLTKAGSSPFHLKISFATFDFSGKPSESGTIEYWWAGPAGSRLDIVAPSLSGTVPNKATQFNARRIRYLTKQLVDSTLAPAAELRSPQLHTESEKRVFGTLVLECLHSVPSAKAPPSPQTRFEVCSDPNTGAIRMIENSDFTIVRNKPGHFGRAQLALDTAISYGGVQAIKGHIDQLEAFDPAESVITLEQPPADTPFATATNEIKLASGAVAGHKISGAVPSYPAAARAEHITGAVILAAVISREGKIDNLFPLASPDPQLTGAAMDAVKSWTYTPYLLNGSPTEVSTTITVHFNMNSGR